MVRISASILSADLAQLGREISAITRDGADAVHVDILDGHFAPNISFGANAVRAVRRFSTLAIEAHLMVSGDNFLTYSMIPEVAEAGADVIIVHIEAIAHIDRMLDLIRSTGKKSGIAINPGTPLNTIQCILPKLDQILIMTVNPGFSGQQFIEHMPHKIKECRDMIQSEYPHIDISVDGGINKHNASLVQRAGANIIVAGAGIFSQNDGEECSYKKAIDRLRNADK